MAVDWSHTTTIDRVLGLRLKQLQQLTGLPVVFGGATLKESTAPQLRIGHLRGTVGKSLLDLRVESGRGLGGSVIQTGALRTVRDYASTRTITHDFDAIVVQEERLSSVFALPVSVAGTVRGVIYGALRGQQTIGDVVLERATTFGASLERELTTLLEPPEPPTQPVPARARAALDKLREVALGVEDETVRDALLGIARDLRELDDDRTPPVAVRGDGVHLAPREIEALQHVAVGLRNSEIAEVMRLRTETVRAYLRSAMHRLNVHNRTAAVHAARKHGLL
ncbi:LuxR C-terminal-related transcriptional regulator [Amycolatopsis sp. 195334CR]|uniref:helix-turn-helix transcriptional regulator n=1 Tax=Amycolatopsis sp. 195334CR TaxID=2814588 RepID=UPI001A8E3D1C|nr:LuxR C-terminal-related transcriptional regulator [Amycolatopsis sp. 195334CR]MBN6040447.1 response regulator transcription factor [Amycolatopsis sp. 195334CR]